jgi:hypothetical protein
VESGAIQVRKHPRDPRFYQFKDEVQKEATVSAQQKVVEGKCEAKVDVQEVLDFMRADLSTLPANILTDGNLAALVSGPGSSNDHLDKSEMQKLSLKKEDEKPVFEKDTNTITQDGNDEEQDMIKHKMNQLEADGRQVDGGLAGCLVQGHKAPGILDQGVEVQHVEE